MKNKNNIATQNTFISFLKDKSQLIDWIILFTSCLIGYITIRICYPYPVTISDSGTYVLAAINDMFSFYRPFGYSYFLQIAHALSSNIHSIFIVQLLLYFISVSLLSLTIKYFFPPKNKVFWYVILFFIVFNPIAFYMSNAIMSDLIFAVMIYFSLSSFIFIIKRQSWIALAFFAISLFMMLHIRYSAMIFPIVFAILSLFFIKGNIKWVTLAAIFLFSGVFYKQVQNSMKEVTGFNQFSTGFDGWQLANNGLHILPFINLDPHNIKNKEIAALHGFSMQFKNDIYKATEGGTNPSASFMWSNNYPLKQFAFHYAQQTRQPYPATWVKLGSGTYKKYGQELITSYPLEYMKYFYWPNAKRIFYPTDFEILSHPEPINGKPDIISWYKLSDNIDTTAKNDIYNKFVLSATQKFIFILWIFVAVTAIFAIIQRRKLNIEKSNWFVFWTIFIFGVVYYSSTAFAGPIMLRFWTGTITFQLIFIYILSNQSFTFGQKRQIE